MMVASTVVGAYMVETAQAAAMSGRLTSLRNFVDQTCLLIRGPAAGVLASIAFGWTAAACGGVLALLFPVVLFILYEQRRRVDAKAILADAGAKVVRIATARTMWAVAGVMAVFYLAPGLSTAVFYKQQNELHMLPAFQGCVLGPVGASCGLCRGGRLRVALSPLPPAQRCSSLRSFSPPARPPRSSGTPRSHARWC